MNDLAIAVTVAAALSLLIGTIEILFQSKANLRASLSGSFALYLLILVVGNTGTTLLASSLLSGGDLPPTLPGPGWFWFAFVGVFGFEAILKNVNVTLFGNGVLSINDWISKARNNATATAIAAYATASVEQEKRLAGELKTLPGGELNTHALHLLGAEALAALLQAAAEAQADERLYLALAIAEARPEEAKAILKARTRPAG